MRRLLLTTLLFLLPLASALRATWSIVAVNLRTGEVVTGCATCLVDFNLRKWVPVVIPEVGVACAQSLLDSGDNRNLIWELLHLGVDPATILQELEAQDGSHQARQYGIADLAGRSATFTGTGAGDWAGGVFGQDGDIVYAIQGNVLAGQPVVDEAEAAFLNTPGDMAEKLMAAMEAAAAMGGDGRCSCGFDADSCGSPPPDFDKSAHNGFMFLARPGDEEGIPSFDDGWANGDYYLWINIAGRGEDAEDPVVQMRQQFDQWRLELQGRPDAILSERTQSHTSFPASTPQVLTIELDLKDVEGNPVPAGGAAISLQHESRSAGRSSLQGVTDHGNGSYTVEVLSGDAPGVDRFRLVVDDGVRPVHLWPPFELQATAADPAPFNDPEKVAGLDSPAHESMPMLRRDGLAAYFLQGDAMNVLELVVAERPDPQSDFGAPAPVGGVNESLFTFTDFWISEDELRLTASGARMVGPDGGVEKLFRSERASVLDPFDRLERIDELDSGLGDGGPWLGEDELQMWFHSRRGGAQALWTSTRLSIDADWFPAESLRGLGDTATSEHLHPMTTEGGTRLLLARGIVGDHPRVWFAERLGDGSWSSPLPHPGALIDDTHEQIPSWMAADGSELWWTNRGRASGMGDPLTATLSAASLSASPDSIQASSGGRVDFTLDAGPDHADAAYVLFGSGASGVAGLTVAGTVLPLQRDAFTTLLLEGGGPLVLSGFDAHLDAFGLAAASIELLPGTTVPAAWLDRDYRFAFLARAHGSAFASNAVAVTFEP